MKSALACLAAWNAQPTLPAALYSSAAFLVSLIAPFIPSPAIPAQAAMLPVATFKLYEEEMEAPLPTGLIPLTLYLSFQNFYLSRLFEKRKADNSLLTNYYYLSCLKKFLIISPTKFWVA